MLKLLLISYNTNLEKSIFYLHSSLFIINIFKNLAYTTIHAIIVLLLKLFYKVDNVRKKCHNDTVIFSRNKIIKTP